MPWWAMALSFQDVMNRNRLRCGGRRIQIVHRVADGYKAEGDDRAKYATQSAPALHSTAAAFDVGIDFIKWTGFHCRSRANLSGIPISQAKC